MYPSCRLWVCLPLAGGERGVGAHKWHTYIRRGCFLLLLLLFGPPPGLRRRFAGCCCCVYVVSRLHHACQGLHLHPLTVNTAKQHHFGWKDGEERSLRKSYAGGRRKRQKSPPPSPLPFCLVMSVMLFMAAEKKENEVEEEEEKGRTNLGHCHVADKSFKVGWRKIRRWLIKTRFLMPLRNRLPIVLADCFLFLRFCESRTFGVTPLHLVFSRRGNDETTSLSHTRNRNCSNRKEGGGHLKKETLGRPPMLH